MTQMREVRGVQTSVRTTSAGTHVNYRGTDVVSFDATNIALNTGGWKSATTKTRMNQASAQFMLGYHVFQKNHSWFVRYGHQIIPFDSERLMLDRP